MADKHLHHTTFTARDGTVVPLTIGSDNVFRDLGRHEPEIALAKSRLAGKIAELIRRKHLTQQQAAERLGVDQPRVSHLVNGRLAGFSLETLVAFLHRLDVDVAIELRVSAEERERVTL